jgi:hypothetical protein
MLRELGPDMTIVALRDMLSADCPKRSSELCMTNAARGVPICQSSSRQSGSHLRTPSANRPRDNESAAHEPTELVASIVELLPTQSAMGRPGRVAVTRELITPNTQLIIPYTA